METQIIYLAFVERSTPGKPIKLQEGFQGGTDPKERCLTWLRENKVQGAQFRAIKLEKKTPDKPASEVWDTGVTNLQQVVEKVTND